MVRYFFHSLVSFRGRNPPCCDVLFVRLGSGVALQVFSIVSKKILIMLSNDVHASCH